MTPVEPQLEAQFGYSVATEGGALAIGAPFQGLPASLFGEGDGGVYVFQQIGHSWVEQSLLKATRATPEARFGHAVALSGDTMVVGAPNEGATPGGPATKGTGVGAGAAYVFVREAGVWVEKSTLRASNAGTGDRFGWSVGISGDTIVVGAYSEDSDPGEGSLDNSQRDAGAAYIFRRSSEDDEWVEEALLKAPADGAPSHFGVSVAISGDAVLVGAPGEIGLGVPLNGSANNLPGNAFLFERGEDGGWAQGARFSSDTPAPDDQFGLAVALCGDLAVTGARRTNAAWIYRRDAEGKWAQEARLDGVQEHSLFGEVVAVDAGKVVVSSRWEDPRGAAHVFYAGEDGLWEQAARLGPPDGEVIDNFGGALGIGGDVVVVGAALEGS